MSMDSKTINDKLPVGYRYGSPLYYCEEDDTLHNSLKELVLHRHDLRIRRMYSLIDASQMRLNDWAIKMSYMKRKSLPQLQESVDKYNQRIKELIGNKDWKSTHATHAAKRREIAEMRYLRQVYIGKLQKEIETFKGCKQGFKNAKECLTDYKDTLREYEAEREKARESYKEKTHD